MSDTPTLTLALSPQTLAEITRLAGLARPAPLSPERMAAVLVCDALLQMALREGRKAEQRRLSEAREARIRANLRKVWA